MYKLNNDMMAPYGDCMIIQFDNNQNSLMNTQSFIDHNSSVYEAKEKLDSSEQELLVVLDENFSIKGSVLKEEILTYCRENNDQDFLKREKISKLIRVKKTTVIIYPQNNISEVITLMKNLKPKAIAIANNPWEKRYMGLITSNDIKKLEMSHIL